VEINAARIKPKSPVQKPNLPVQSESSAVQLSKSPYSYQIPYKVVEFTRIVTEFRRSVVEFSRSVVEFTVQLSKSSSSCQIHPKVVISECPSYLPHDPNGRHRVLTAGQERGLAALKGWPAAKGGFGNFTLNSTTERGFRQLYR